MGKAIPEEDLTAGKLAQYLLPEDYRPIKQVNLHCTLFWLDLAAQLVF